MSILFDDLEIMSLKSHLAGFANFSKKQLSILNINVK